MSFIKCERCGEKLNPKTAKWLELSETDGNYYADKFPIHHVSQGGFSFGTACATRQINETIENLKNAKKNKNLCVV